ncbi:semaphorin-5A isoform X2 [Fopius arisanus]|uniref:Semaphorin-5A isoform X2 n=1 Tax=Fopius arisanus TaxID=64838 RepID=A0A9R1T221_9HYME|nr:PREDICTED: semaphorin-5A isoform X2 [Fopius arisanus]
MGGINEGNSKVRGTMMWIRVTMMLSALALTAATGDFRHISYEDLVERSSLFYDEGVTTYSQLLFDVARQQVVVGARDNLYRLTLNSLTLLEHATWPAPLEKASICQDKGQTAQDCHNYIKVLLSNGKSLFTCGTHAFSPQCTWREIENIKSVTSTVSGVAMCPYSPHANVTALLARGNAGLFAGAPTDFSGADAAIYRTLASPSLRTHQYDSRWLNDPQFVGSFETENHVYFLFREIAVEYINCGKKIYSRIARVCKKDPGGQPLMRDTWTSFSKARLNCSLPGEFPFYYDEIQGAAYNSEEGIVYATFTTPSNAIAGSAICAFNMTAIASSFNGPFKHQEHSGAAWEKKRVTNHYKQYCGTPVNVPDHQIMDNQRYQLMDDAVQGTTISPLHSTTMERFTHIAVDVVPTKLHRGVTVLYVATAEGLVKKISVLPRTHETCIVEVWGPLPSPAMSLQFLKDSQSLYVGMETGLLRIPASQCHRHKNRGTCLNAQEPYCGWNEYLMKCDVAPMDNHLANHWQQEVTRCPVLTDPVDGGWSVWGAWAPCQHSTSSSLYPRSHLRPHSEHSEPPSDICQCQTRECNNPPPQNGGSSCSGPRIQVSNCTVHGGWTAWSAWSACSQTCGFAIKTRRRTCTNPAPAFGGRVCVGHDHDEIVCIEMPPCPAPAKSQPPPHAQWSSWGPWDSCSKPCNSGIRMRRRTCDKPSREGGSECPGCSFQIEDCNTHLCPETKRYSSWTPWLPSTNVSGLQNGAYMEKRFKFSCKAHTEDPSSVRSQLVKEERFCRDDGSCSRTNITLQSASEIEGTWSDWSPWYPCTKNCGGGSQHRVRQCETPPCEGAGLQSRVCNVHACRDDSEGEWSCWTDWSECSVFCGTGVKSRSRECLKGSCQGPTFMRESCEMPSCDSLRGWDAWSKWSACDSAGQQSRRRVCVDPSNGGCQGGSRETRDCYEDWHGEITSNALPRSVVAAGLPVGAVVGGCIVGFLAGVGIAVGVGFVYVKKRKVRVPGSPHYISKQNPYVAVPLKECCFQVNAKRAPSFSGARDLNGTLRKPNPNVNGLGSPKLYPKALDYESATLKRNSHGQQHIRADLDQEKYY